MRDLDTCDELGTDVGSTLERDGEARCYCMPYLLFTPHPFTRFPERLSLSPAHYAIKSSFPGCSSPPLPERARSVVRFDDILPGSQLLATVSPPPLLTEREL